MNNAIYSIGYTLITKGFTFIVNLLAVKYLLLKDYGVFSIFLSTANSLVILTSLGLLYCGNVVVSKWMDTNKEFVFSYFKFSFYIISFLSFIILFIGYFLTSFYLEIFLCVYVFSLVTLMESFFYGLNSIKNLFTYSIINIIIAILFSFFLIKEFGLYGAILSFCMSKSCLLLLQLLDFSKYFDKKLLVFSIYKKKNILGFYKKHNLPLLFSGLISTPVITLVLYVLSFFKGTEEVAIYAWCYQIYLLGMILPASLGTYYLTILNRKKNLEKKILMSKISIFNVSITFLTILILYLISPLLMEMGGLSYSAQALKTFNMFLVCMFFYSLNMNFMSFWVSIGKSSYFVKLQLLWVAVVLTTLLVFVEKYGAVSIPLAMSLAYLVQYIVQKLKFNIYFNRLKTV